MNERPEPTEAAQLIERRRLAPPKMSIREAASEAQLSEGRWRQIAKGYMFTSSVVVPVNAPPETIARMARAVGVTSDELRAVDALEAADILSSMVANRLSHPSQRGRLTELAMVPDEALVEELSRRLRDGRTAAGQLREIGLEGLRSRADTYMVTQEGDGDDVQLEEPAPSTPPPHDAPGTSSRRR